MRNALHSIRNIGYEAVQASALGPVAPGKVKAAADASGLRLCAADVPFAALERAFADVVAVHRLWGCRYVVVDAVPDAYRASEAGYAAFAREAGAIAGRLRDRGLAFVFRGRRYALERFGGRRTGLEILLDETDPESVGFAMDPFEVQAGGAFPVDWIRRTKDRLSLVYLQDMAVVGGRPVPAEIGQGNLNHEAIVAACREAGADWYVVGQDECRRDPFESLAISYRHLKTYF
ncbi:sugar phosphate isomerase/epimerase [Cohnella sp. REN36]|uniref:sugar phosphate isomerase/epimerase family protein n=1 Tax=Cohnella sp. REN36 TaxID=2887347 RepID=UPI001D1584A1|nr:TIM barrel protein [Cohnella sp. REN36]MCC3373995.1 TIM barrel protein [Cohnella sp. REN36]